MDAIQLLKTRSSNGKLTDPAPDADTLRLALEAAARSPDHAGLKPWRVSFVRGAAREQLGDLLAGALKRAEPDADQDDLEKARRKAFRAPLVIVVGAVVREHRKVPDVEQVLAAGAAAHAILLTLHARGYAAIWRTGAPAYDPEVKRAFGLEARDALVGFIYAGTAKQAAPSLNRPAPEEFASEWSGR
ncbi:MAG: nitroreductase [Polyangiales bacterium]